MIYQGESWVELFLRVSRRRRAGQLVDWSIRGITYVAYFPYTKEHKLTLMPDLLQYFFHPRRMEIILAQGTVRLSGNSNAPLPSLQQGQERHGVLYSSSDDEYGSYNSEPERHTRRGDRRARRSQRRERKAESRDTTYRLFVVAR